MEFNPEEVAIIFSPDMKTFAERVYESLSVKLGEQQRPHARPVMLGESLFNSDEWYEQIPTNVRKRHVYVIHPFTEEFVYSPNDGLVQLLLIGDALRRSSAGYVTYILPHISYQRQDRMTKPREAISAKVIFDTIKATTEPLPFGIVTFDMHADQIQGFGNFPLDHLPAAPLFVRYFSTIDDPKIFVVVSPDTGGAKRARRMAEKLNGGDKIAIVDKKRPEPGKAEVMYVIGKEIIVGRPCIMIDDIADTGGTAISAYHALKENGAGDVFFCATHAIFSQDKKMPERKTEEEFRKSGMKVVVTDTIPRDPSYYEMNKHWLDVVSVAPTVAEIIYRIQTGGSVSQLYE